MKALQITQYGELKESLSLNEIEKPKINEDDLLVEVEGASLNPIDYKLVQGKLKKQINLDFPTCIGFDVSGVVVEKGNKVSDFEIRDEVYARVPHEQMGTVAEYVAVKSEVVAKKSTAISFEEAAGLPLVGLTAMQALERVNMKEGDRILIHAGSGGVGSFAIQYAKSKGAYVFTTTSTKNVDWVKALGADRVIDYKKEDYKEIATDLDIVFDTLGEDYTFEAFGLIKEGGAVSTIVGPPDEETAKSKGMKDYTLPEKLAEMIRKKSAKYKLTWMQPNREQLQEINALLENDHLKPVVDEVYSFGKSVEAYEHLATGRAKGKIIISL